MEACIADKGTKIVSSITCAVGYFAHAGADIGAFTPSATGALVA
jgi:hypothetical protein